MQSVNTAMREDYTRFNGIFGPECFTYAILFALENNRFAVRLGDSSRPIYGFTYRGQAVDFLEGKNAEGKAEVLRILADRAAAAAAEAEAPAPATAAATAPAPAAAATATAAAPAETAPAPAAASTTEPAWMAEARQRDEIRKMYEQQRAAAAAAENGT